jgi:Lipid A core - O-antigen ligase and related enzymes
MTTTTGVLQSQTAQGLPVQGSHSRRTLCAGGGLLCLALYTLAVLHVDVPHLPGSGMLIPQSVLAWMLAAALMLLAAFASRQSLAVALRPSPFLLLSLAGVVILTLPLLYAPRTWRYLAELRVAGLWGGVLLMVAARALFTTPSLRRTVLVLMLAGCLLEAMTGIAQSLYPQSLPVWLTASGSGRATGVFRQSSVLASFIGTGVLLTGCLLGRTTRRSVQGLILAATAVLAVCLPLTQSTQMWLTLAVVVALACLPFMRIPGQRGLMRLWWGVLAAGVLAGFLFWHGLHGDLVNHAPGRYGRLQMWQNCLWLIAHRPWLGWGTGILIWLMCMRGRRTAICRRLTWRTPRTRTMKCCTG